jgi:hypothetical protein
MTTSPSRNDLISGSVRPHDVDVPVKATNVSTAPTVATIAQKQDLQNS